MLRQLLQFLPENSSRAIPILLSSLQGTKFTIKRRKKWNKSSFVKQERFSEWFTDGFSQVRHAVDMERPVSRYIYDCECLQPLDLGCANLEDSQMTPSSVLYAEVSSRNTTSSGSCSDGDGGVGCLNVGCTATTEKVTRKKLSTRVAVANFCDRITPRSVSKRKGLPLRSPLY